MLLAHVLFGRTKSFDLSSVLSCKLVAMIGRKELGYCIYVHLLLLQGDLLMPQTDWPVEFVDEDEGG